MEIRIAGLIENSFVDGEGIRFAIFTQGCPHHCKGCHNPKTHDFNGGKVVDTNDLINIIKKTPLISGITLTGGEPLCQIAAVTELASTAKNLNLNVWCYTGYVYENLFDKNLNDEKFFTADKLKNFFDCVDVLVDGPFIESQRDLTLPFCGSKNQRLIDIKKTQLEKKIIFLPLP